MNTTIYLPMPEWQALAFLRNRNEAFRRLVTPAGNHLPCEVVLVEDGLFGFRNRQTAVETGMRVYPLGFAMVRIVLVGKVIASSMTFNRQLIGVNDGASGAELWRINRDGLQVLADRVEQGEAEILVDQIFSTSAQDHDVVRHTAQHGQRNHGMLEEGGRPVFGGGPTGFGC